MRSFYDRYWIKQEILGDFFYKWPKIKQFIPKEKNIKLLDFGCGKGQVLNEILKINPTIKICGLDISGNAINHVKKRFPKHKFIKISDGKKLPLQTDNFNFITVLDVMEHVYDTEQIYKELSRVLKKGGSILISVPYYGLIKNIVISLFFFSFVFNPYTPHIRFYTKKNLIKCLTSVGLKPYKVGYYGLFFPFWKGMYVLARK